MTGVPAPGATRPVWIGDRGARAVHGGGPALLLNGIGGNLDMWQPVVSRIRDRQLVVFDVPGTAPEAS